jgi:FkbH-like protein
MFLDDLVGNNMNYKEVTRVISDTIENLETHLNKTSNNTIFCFSTANNYNVIENSKSMNQTKQYSYLLNMKLSEIAFRYDNFFIVDIDAIFSRTGFLTCFDLRNWYHFFMRLSNHGLKILGESIVAINDRIHNPPKKVLVLDCDNTLWGGVVSEDGIDSLTLGGDGQGRIYLDFQRIILQHHKNGLILALSSKNNEEDVLNVFNNHPNMLIKLENITAYRINWQNKSENIQELSKELNLGVDSFIFWDDNPIERQEVSYNLPEVSVPSIPNSIEFWPKTLAELNSLTKLYITEEDLSKNIQYEIKNKFEKNISVVKDKPTFLKSINQKINHFEIDQFNLQRAEQICLKTNQFNFRSIRHTKAQLMKLLKTDVQFSFLTHLADDYGDHGLIGLVIVRKTHLGLNYIDTFALSCRAFGRDIEYEMMKNIIKESKKMGINELYCEFVFNPKNSDILKQFIKDNPVNLIDSFPKTETSLIAKNYFSGKVFKIEVNKHS